MKKALESQEIGFEREISGGKACEDPLNGSYDEPEHGTEERICQLMEANEQLRHEIQELKQTEKALRESEERYRTAIENSNDGVAIVEGNQLIFVNQKLGEIFGRDQPDHG